VNPISNQSQGNSQQPAHQNHNSSTSQTQTQTPSPNQSSPIQLSGEHNQIKTQSLVSQNQTPVTSQNTNAAQSQLLPDQSQSSTPIQGGAVNATSQEGSANNSQQENPVDIQNRSQNSNNNQLPDTPLGNQ
jgi:hypothetical protein